MRLYDLATVVRSKNAGPFTLTVDIMLENGADFDRVLRAPTFTAVTVADLYGVAAETVRIHPFRRVLAIKVSLPRPFASSGAPGDPDVYGSQQEFPLADIEV